jgi:hypothetical protein
VQNTLLTLVLAVSLCVHIYYSYLEGNISPGLAYKSRAASEFKICYDSKGYKDTIVFPYVYNMLTTLLKKT